MSSHPFRSESAKERYLAWYDARAAQWPVEATAADIATSHGPTHVRISGPVTAMPLVLLPGIGSSSLMFAPVVEGLSRDHRVIAIDNANDYGRSANSRAFTTAADFVAWIDSLLEALAISEATFLGVSYGAWIAAEYALQRPERCAALILAAPAATVAPLSKLFLAGAVSTALPLKVLTKRFMGWLASDALAAGGHAAAEVEHAVEGGFLASRSFVRRQPVPPRILDDDDLRALPNPCLFLVGVNDVVFDPQAALCRLQSVAPSVQTTLVSGAGHDLVLVRPDALIQAAALASLGYKRSPT